MKRNKFLALLLRVGLILTWWGSGSSALADLNEWELLGPPGGQVSVMTIDPQNPETIYVGMSHSTSGLYKSIDAGASWTLLSSVAVRSLATDSQRPGTLYLVGGCHTFRKSTDGGNTWVDSSIFVVGGLPSFGCSLKQVITDPIVQDIVYAVIQGSGVYKSTDGGANWNPVNTGLTNLDVTLLAIHPIHSLILYVGTFQGTLFRSLDGGLSWIQTGTISSGPVTALAVDPQTPTTIYAGTGGFGLFKSVDGGVSWNSLVTGLPSTGISIILIDIDPSLPSTVYVGVESHGLYKSVDGGASWNQIFTLGNPAAFAINPDNPNTLYLGTSFPFETSETGVFKSGDGGATWTPVNNGIKSHLIDGLTLDPTNPTTVYAVSRGQGLFKSVDQGITWIPIGSSITRLGSSLATDPLNPQVLYLAAGGNGLFKSVDGGANWNSINAGLLSPFGQVQVLVQSQNPNIVYTTNVTNPGLYKSTNGGGNWTLLFPLSPTPPGITAELDPNNPNILYAWVTGQGIFKSVDGGVSWVAINNGLSTSMIHSPQLVKVLKVSPEDSMTLYAASDLETFKSTNGGMTWMELNPLHNIRVTHLVMDPLDHNILYVGGPCNAGVRRSSDGGVKSSSVIPARGAPNSRSAPNTARAFSLSVLIHTSRSFV